MKPPAKLALIPPFCMLDDTVCRYYMYLPQLMISPRYAEFVKKTNTEMSYTILDNGAFEGVTTRPRDLVSLAVHMNVDEVVVPDVLHDMRGTIAALENFYLETSDLRLGSAVGLKYMVVPQGITIEEYMNCIDAIMQFNFIDTIGLPKHIVRTITRTARVQLTAYIREKYGQEIDIHLLGASPLWPQEIKIARRHNVRGIDTSLPYFYAYYDIDISEPMEEERPPKYFQLPRSAFSNRLDWNIKTLLEWCNE